jgi:hypothetical protein
VLQRSAIGTCIVPPAPRQLPTYYLIQVVAPQAQPHSRHRYPAFGPIHKHAVATVANPEQESRVTNSIDLIDSWDDCDQHRHSPVHAQTLDTTSSIRRYSATFRLLTKPFDSYFPRRSDTQVLRFGKPHRARALGDHSSASEAQPALKFFGGRSRCISLPSSTIILLRESQCACILRRYS